jgi:hypothetical protein
MMNEAFEMTKMPVSVLRVATFCLPLVLIASCGSGSEAVQGTVMTFTPAKLGQATTLGTSGSNGQVFRIAATSPTGYPQLGVKILIDSQYEVYAGRPTVVCVGNTCNASGATPLPLPYETTTDTNGTYEVTVIYSWGTAINGDFTAVEAWSGTGYGNATITYKCTDPDTTAPPDCP